jgi:hypothetical protein
MGDHDSYSDFLVSSQVSPASARASASRLDGRRIAVASSGRRGDDRIYRPGMRREAARRTGARGSPFRTVGVS